MSPNQLHQVVEFDSGNELPLTYEPDILKDYYGKRPLLALRRLFQARPASPPIPSPPARTPPSHQSTRSTIRCAHPVISAAGSAH